MTVVAAKWTLAEYHRMIAAGVLDNRRVELLKGEIVEMPPEGEPHAYFVIEYSEASLSKDLNLKSRVYAEVNITKHWIANLKARSLIVFRAPQSGQYSSCTSYTEGEITPLAFPDISISVSAIINRS